MPKIMFKIKWFIQVCLFFQSYFFCTAVAAQEPLNTQLQYSNVGRNPALAGMQVSDLCINFSYQPQNQNFLIPFKAFQFQIETTFHQKESLDGLTIASLIKYDEVGINQLKRAQFLPVLNFHKSLSDVRVSFLNMAFMPGIFKTQFDQMNLPNTKNFNPIPFNPLSPVPQFIEPNSSAYFDFSTGISVYEVIDNQISYYIGAALFHFSQNSLKQNQSISKMPREWVINSGLFLKNEHYSLQLIEDLRITQFEKTFYSACVVGLPISKDLLNQSTDLNVGAYYNNKQELSPLLNLKWPSGSLSFSYTFFIGKTKGIPILPNAFECNASININCHNRTIESEKMKCAKIW